MDEPKTLKSLEILARQTTNLNDTHHLSQIELSAKLNEWMLSQHNVAIRHISPYLNQLRLDNEEQNAIERRKSNVSLSKLFESLKEDCEEFERVKQSVDSMHSVNSKFLFCSNSLDTTEKSKKIIRFKFGFMKILQNQIQSLESQINNLKSQFELFSLIPEVFDRESLHVSTVSIENQARHIVNQCKSSCQSASVAPKNSINAPDCAKMTMFNGQTSVDSDESLCKDDEEDDDLQKIQKVANGQDLELFDSSRLSANRQRKTSTFMENSDELDSSNDSIERHAEPDPHLNNISQRLSNLELSKFKCNVAFAKNSQDFDFIQLADTLNASDLYQNAAPTLSLQQHARDTH